MYAYEDRIRAVELYIKLGKRVNATIRQLGYPTKNALKSWFREYEKRRDLPRGYACANPGYSKEQKEAAVRHYLENGRCFAATMRALGYPGRASLTAWVREFDSESRVRFASAAEASHNFVALNHAAALALCTRQGVAGALAQDVGVHVPTMYNQLLGCEASETPMPQPQEMESQIE